MAYKYELVIKPSVGWRPIDFREIWRYRELLWFLVWRDLKIRYRQTALGVAWAVLQPLIMMLTFTVFFNRLGRIESGGPPYALFAFVGLLGWTFFANAVTASSSSLIGNERLISKIYFPRLYIPLGGIVALAIDLVPSIFLCFLLMAYYRWPLTAAVFWLPIFIFGTFLAASGVGLMLSALNVQFRDIKYVIPFLVQFGLFVTPVIYPVDLVPEKYRIWLGLNPMSGMVEGLRYAFLGGSANWRLITESMTVSVALFVAGTFVFRRMERRFADLI
jgi:lipopolysaccharide transport system permease protein